MELDAVDRPLAMGDANDDAVLGLGGDRQRRRQPGAVDDERMIARRREGVGQAGEDAAAAMADAAHLAMHRHRRAHDAAAQRLADRLVAEADAEDRHAAGAPHQLEADARMVGGARPPRDDDGLPPERARCFGAERVVALYHHLGAQLAQVMPQVIGEAVVVIDKQEHGLDPKTAEDGDNSRLLPAYESEGPGAMF